MQWCVCTPGSTSSSESCMNIERGIWLLKACESSNLLSVLWLFELFFYFWPPQNCCLAVLCLVFLCRKLLPIFFFSVWLFHCIIFSWEAGPRRRSSFYSLHYWHSCLLWYRTKMWGHTSLTLVLGDCSSWSGGFSSQKVCDWRTYNCIDKNCSLTVSECTLVFIVHTVAVWT